MKLVIATRASELALWQAHHIRDRLLATPACGVDAVELLKLTTRGDKILDVALSKVGGKGLFVKELEEAIADGRADFAVHSMKDMPAELPPGFELAAVPPRANPFDAWVRPEGSAPLGPMDLPAGATVGTSSLRRASQLLAARPDLKVAVVRGNVGTRLRKLQEGVDGMQALILASAGLERLGLGHRITHQFDAESMLPAVGQGTLGLEIREGDTRVRAALDALHDVDAADRVAAERAFLGAVEGGCQVPIGAFATVEGATLTIEGIIAEPDGTKVFRHRVAGPRADAERLGRSLATTVLEAGGADVLARLLA